MRCIGDEVRRARMLTTTNTLILGLEEIQITATDPEERRIISPVPWEEYSKLADRLGDSSRYRVSYLDGTLVIMSPSRSHEKIKKHIAVLLEAYLQEAEIDYYPLGSTTFRKEEGRVGKEPDECYCIGSEKEFPDLAIEISVTSGGVDTLEVYKRLGIKEVWLWKNNRFSIYFLAKENYVKQEKSTLLPDLDIGLIEKLAIAESPRKAVQELRKNIRSKYK
ncbi:MAG: Uma2 family endonuclease [Prochloraceae cyanobacterium]|nr:Uma2 family endonuclease [Prochloraceae cyanobacterium]